MSATKSTATIAFFGATGGVTNACLVYSLRAGYKAVALVRTPEKLRTQLLNQGLDEAILNNQLTIIQGNALDVAAVKRTLRSPASGAFPAFIVTGLGSLPRAQFAWRHPLQLFTLQDPTICETAANTLVAALGEIYTEQPELRAQKPILTFISTTGISHGPEDVPHAMRLFYHQILAVPHADKRKMEAIYRDNAASPDSPFRSVIGIRPTLLAGAGMVSEGAGLQAVRTGTEPKPVLGYSIKRADVGHWVFENIIHDKAARTKWEGQMVSMTS